MHFRIAHGVAFLLFLTACWQQGGAAWLTDAGFHYPDEEFPPLSAEMLPFFALLQFSAALLFIAGWKVRWMAAICWAGLLYVTLADRLNAFSINSIYLFSLSVFTLFPGSRTPNSWIPATPIRLLQLAMLSVYFSSGWHKAVHGDWIDSPTALRTILQGIYMTDIAAWAVGALPRWVFTLSQYSVVAFEVLSPTLFYSRRLLPFAIFSGALLHLGITLCMNQLVYFSLQMVSFYFLFAFPDQDDHGEYGNSKEKP